MNALNNQSQTESSVTSVPSRALDFGVHGSFGWNGVPLLVATVAVFGLVDYRLLRFYAGAAAFALELLSDRTGAISFESDLSPCGSACRTSCSRELGRSGVPDERTARLEAAV